jgi:aminoglycoside phosphotransferase
VTDDLRLLTGPRAQDLLRALLADTGEEPVSWRVRSVDHRPGSGTTVTWSATTRGPQGERRQLLAAATGARPVPGALLLSEEGRDVLLWRFPLDPALPALATALDEQSVRDLLQAYGVAPGPLRLDLRTYRPGRRAVVEVQAPRRRLFLKVLRPKGVHDLHDRHRLLTAAGVPVPRSLGCTDQGLLVLDALSGTSMRTRLREGGTPMPDGRAVLDLLDRLPAAASDLPRRPSWTDQVVHYAQVVAAALPSQGERCRQLAAAVVARTSGSSATAPSHGDLYESQLLLDGVRISGLLDVDTVGPGRRGDDLACLLAHVAVLAQLEPTHRSSSTAVVERWLGAFERAVDPLELRARVAGVVVSLATGPHRVQQADWERVTLTRLDLAEAWLAR